MPPFLLRLLIWNQALAALLTLGLGLLLGLRQVPAIWLPTWVFTNGVGGCVGLAFWLLGRSPAYRDGGPVLRNLARAGAVTLGTGLGLALSLAALGLLRPGLRLRPGDLWPVFAFSLLVSTVMASLNLLLGRLRTHIEQKVIENRQLREMEVQTRLASLQGKVNPHFLFNTLNTLLSLVRRDPDRAEALILQLSELYRGVLQLPEQGRIPLGRELELVRRYLEIEQLRLGGRLEFHIEAEPGVAELLLPPLLVEPLVENAVKHGIAPKPGGGCIRISARGAEGLLVVRVEDDGEGVGSGSGAGGFGTYGIRERLRLQYGEAARLRLLPRPGEGFTAELEVPCD